MFNSHTRKRQFIAETIDCSERLLHGTTARSRNMTSIVDLFIPCDPVSSNEMTRIYKGVM